MKDSIPNPKALVDSTTQKHSWEVL